MALTTQPRLPTTLQASLGDIAHYLTAVAQKPGSSKSGQAPDLEAFRARFAKVLAELGGAYTDQKLARAKSILMMVSPQAPAGESARTIYNRFLEEGQLNDRDSWIQEFRMEKITKKISHGAGKVSGKAEGPAKPQIWTVTQRTEDGGFDLEGYAQVPGEASRSLGKEHYTQQPDGTFKSNLGGQAPQIPDNGTHDCTTREPDQRLVCPL